MHYYQFNIGDYASHTGYLSPMEDLAYRRLLDHYYLHEKPIVDDVGQVCRVIGLRDFEAEVTQVLNDFFRLDDGFWKSKRVEQEIDSYRSKADVARENGKKGGRPKGTTKPKETQPVNSDNPTLTQQEPSPNPEITGSKANHKPLTINQEPLTSKETVQRKRFTPPIKNEVYGYMVERGLDSNQAITESEKFMDHYLSNGWKVGRNAMKNWKAAVRNWTKGKDYGSHQQAPAQRGQIDHDDTTWLTGADSRATGGDRSPDQQSLQRINGNLPSMETGVCLDHDPGRGEKPVDEGADGSWSF